MRLNSSSSQHIHYLISNMTWYARRRLYNKAAFQLWRHSFWPTVFAFCKWRHNGKRSALLDWAIVTKARENNIELVRYRYHSRRYSRPVVCVRKLFVVWLNKCVSLHNIYIYMYQSIYFLFPVLLGTVGMGGACGTTATLADHAVIWRTPSDI